MAETAQALPEAPIISNRILKLELVNWHELAFVQQDDFKELDAQERHALKSSLLKNQFADPFKVWEDPEGKIYCLDGKHRSMVLNELVAEGVQVPYQLPAVFFDCANKQEAAKLVLVFSSYYARIRQEGLKTFLGEYELDWSQLKQGLNLPEFSFDRFEQKIDLYGLGELEQEDNRLPSADSLEELPLLVKQEDVFRLGNHVLVCGSFRSLLVNAYLNEEKARIVFTDPPYNLSASSFTNNGSVKHADFAEGGGEMTDEEFKRFLADIMMRSSEFSEDGAIHYICMDWRHVWHMTEAAAQVYGSMIPKQVICWKKDFATNGSFYRSQHELIFLFKHGNAKHTSKIDYVDRYRSNVWEYPSGHSVANEDRDLIKKHPTPKPVQMVADAILDTSNEGELVIDWFMGSGTTLIAAEKTKRRSFGTEIQPRYVQNIILRYRDYCTRNGMICEFEHLNGSLTLSDFDEKNNKPDA